MHSEQHKDWSADQPLQIKQTLSNIMTPIKMRRKLEYYTFIFFINNSISIAFALLVFIKPGTMSFLT